MKNRNLMVALGLTILIAVLTCNAIDLSGSSGRTILSNITKNASNSTNLTSNSTYASTGKLSDLWRWGSLPAGYRMMDNQIIAGSSLESNNESVMETPSQLVPDNNVETSGGGMLVRPK
jgi:hypothetical protein